MARKWISTGYPGVRYRNHETRKCGRNYDRYYSIRYRPGKGLPQKEEGVGWTSDGFTPESVATLLSQIKNNIKTGTGPQSLEETQANAVKAREDIKRATGPKFVTLSEMFDNHYLEWAKNNKPGSWDDDSGRFEQHLRPVLGDKRLTEITRQDVENLKTALTKKKKLRRGEGTLSPATVTQCLTLLRGIFYLAANTPFYDDDPNTMIFEGINPAHMSKKYKSGIKPPRISNFKERVYNEAELKKILDLTKEKYPDLHDIIVLTLDQGYRLAEVLNLEGQRINVADWSIFVDAKKHTRRIYAGVHKVEAIEILKKRIKSHGKGLLFPSPKTGRQRDSTAVSKLFKKITNKLEINKGYTDTRFILTFHDLRAWYCTKWFELGAPAYSIMEQMGHESLETTMRYERLSDKQKREVALKRGGVIPGHHQSSQS